MNIAYPDPLLVRERADWEASAAVFRPDDVTFRQLELGGVAAEEASRQTGGAPPKRTILYLHGGGYVAGSSRTHRRVTAALARHGTARVVALDYRLAPEHPFPAALDDAVAAVVALYDTVEHPGALALAGDSAGGGLALATLLALRDRGDALPGCAWLVSPWANLTRPADHDPSCPSDPILTPGSLARSAAVYVGLHDAAHPCISPAFGDFRSLPPLLVQVGAHELLIDDALAIIRAAAVANVSARMEVLPSITHSYVLLAGVEVDVDRQIDAAMRWVMLYTSLNTQCGDRSDSRSEL